MYKMGCIEDISEDIDEEQFIDNFINQILLAGDFAVAELINKILFWALQAEKQNNIIFTKIDKEIYNNEKLIQTYIIMLYRIVLNI